MCCDVKLSKRGLYIFDLCDPLNIRTLRHYILKHSDLEDSNNLNIWKEDVY